MRDRGGKLPYVQVRHDDGPVLRWYTDRCCGGTPCAATGCLPENRSSCPLKAGRSPSPAPMTGTACWRRWWQARRRCCVEVAVRRRSDGVGPGPASNGPLRIPR
ncbi:hypothetical protein [Nonomuraea sp. KM90]|uniref:hypothetical protein n=1 Tax=Nonomuraea sp. KM90 TaxID=3457428 RepID=UPI003FCD172B